MAVACGGARRVAGRSRPEEAAVRADSEGARHPGLRLREQGRAAQGHGARRRRGHLPRTRITPTSSSRRKCSSRSSRRRSTASRSRCSTPSFCRARSTRPSTPGFRSSPGTLTRRRRSASRSTASTTSSPARSWARQAAKLLNGKGTVAFITSLGANNLARRLDGAKDALAKYPGIKIVETFDIKEDSVRCAEIIASGTNRYPDLGAWISVGGWPVFTANALDAGAARRRRSSRSTRIRRRPISSRPARCRCCSARSTSAGAARPCRCCTTSCNGKRPANAVIDSGVDVVTKDNVDAYVAGWNKLASGGS